MPVCSIVKPLPLGTVDDLMHYCTRPSAACNSASGRPRHLRVIVYSYFMPVYSIVKTIALITKSAQFWFQNVRLVLRKRVPTPETTELLEFKFGKPCLIAVGHGRLRSAMAGRLYKLQSKHTSNSGFDQTFIPCSGYILFAAEQRVGYQISWVGLQREVNCP